MRTSQVTGIVLLRLADAEVLPFDYEAYGHSLEYVSEVERSATSLGAGGVTALDFAGLRRAVQAVIKAGADLSTEGDALLTRQSDSAALGRLNRRLIQGERAFTDPAGLPDRPWFRHVIYAPGLYTGYDVKALPGIREAVEAHDVSRAAQQSQVVIHALNRVVATLDGSAGNQ